VSRSKKIRHKLCNLLRFGYRQGWIVPMKDGSLVIAQSSPGYFHDKLRKFGEHFKSEQMIA
jgi:hypothetical protein